MVKQKDFKRCFGFYKGQVLKHMPHGACKIWIPSIHDDNWKDTPDKLPNAYPAVPLFGGVYSGNGLFSYPNINAIVWVFFENGDQNFPHFFAGTLEGKDAHEEWDEICPYLPDGGPSNIHKFNTEQCFLTFNQDGKITLCSWSRTDPTQMSKIVISKYGDIIINSSQSITLDAPVITLKAGQSINVNTPSYTNTNAFKNEIISPSICLNASSGMVIAKSMLNMNGSPLI